MIKILAIESSCDETAASVVEDGCKVLSNVINSQANLHKKYGGVVPEVASRLHIEAIDGVVKQALIDASCTIDDIDAIAVTYAPGLVGSLLVGLSYAKAYAFATGKPLIGVHHIEGHRSESWICMDYTDVIVHVFSDEAREYYGLDRLWQDGESVDLSGYITED